MFQALLFFKCTLHYEFHFLFVFTILSNCALSLLTILNNDIRMACYCLIVFQLRLALVKQMRRNLACNGSNLVVWKHMKWRGTWRHPTLIAAATVFNLRGVCSCNKLSSWHHATSGRTRLLIQMWVKAIWSTRTTSWATNHPLWSWLSHEHTRSWYMKGVYSMVFTV